jgi:Na+-driven multidrug efflux pump
VTELPVAAAPPGLLRRAGGLAVGASAALVADPLVGLVDVAVAGRLGLTEQAALAIGVAAVTLAAWLLNALLFAQTSEVAAAWGAGDRAAAARAVRSGSLAAVLAGGVVALLLIAVAGPLLLAGVSDPVAQQARAYVNVRACGLPLLAFVLAGHGALRGRGDVRGSATIALSAAALHTAGAGAVLVTDRGLSELALVGVGAQVLAALAIAVRLHVGGLLRRGAAGRRPTWAELADGLAALRRAGPLALRGVGLGVSTSALTAAAASIGPTEAAAHLVTYQVWLLIALALEGWKAATQVIVAQDRALPAAGLRAQVRTLERGAAVLGSVAGLGMLATVPFLPALLAADAASADAARPLWALAGLALAAGSLAFTRDGVQFGLRRYRANAVRTLRGSAVWLGAAAGGALTGQLTLLWAGFLLGLVVRALGRVDPAPQPGMPEAQQARLLP